jgi:hypothetical protein
MILPRLRSRTQNFNPLQQRLRVKSFANRAKVFYKRNCMSSSSGLLCLIPSIYTSLEIHKYDVAQIYVGKH